MALAGALWAGFAGPGALAQDRAGDFDYYVLSLSWSPNWCALEGDDRGARECEAGAARGWVLHGLWPQRERGWPQWCADDGRNPSRRDTAAMADIMGSGDLAWYQWRKHGRCAGTGWRAYFDDAREAYGRVTRPEVLRRLDREVTLPARLIEEAFLTENPDLSADAITITCRAGRIQEARICLTKDLAFRRCGADVIRDCSLTDAGFAPLR